MTRPIRPTPLLPDPSRTETGLEVCNEPLYASKATGPFFVEQQLVGYCQRLVRRRRSRWRKPSRGHRGPHRIEWWS